MASNLVAASNPQDHGLRGPEVTLENLCEYQAGELQFHEYFRECIGRR